MTTGAALLVLSLGCGGGGGEAQTETLSEADLGFRMILRSKDVIKSGLKDPESIRWGDVEARRLTAEGKSTVVACGRYNAKNSFGGYTGERRFLSNGLNVTVTEEQASESEFAEMWRLMCTGPVVAKVAG